MQESYGSPLQSSVVNGREGARLGALPVFWVRDDSGLNQDGEAGVDRKAWAREGSEAEGIGPGDGCEE